MTILDERPPISSLTRDLLAWIARQPRSYAEAMDAWRTSCPRFPIWEDAIDAGFIQIESAGAGQREATVTLTQRGHAALSATR